MHLLFWKTLICNELKIKTFKIDVQKVKSHEISGFKLLKIKF